MRTKWIAVAILVLAALVLLIALRSYIPWRDAALMAPLFTTVVAFSAVVVAAIGIAVQWRMARKRAAIDFFLKTDMDQHLVEAYNQFWDAIKVMQATPTVEEFC